MLAYVRRQWPHRRWAIEGAHGVERALAHRVLADGETVVDMPAKLAARVRVFDTGNARKTDATDAHAIAATAPGIHERQIPGAALDGVKVGADGDAVVESHACAEDVEPGGRGVAAGVGAGRGAPGGLARFTQVMARRPVWGK